MEFKTFDIFEHDKPDKEEEQVSLVPVSGVGLIAGKPGAGKTTLIKKMLQHVECLYKKYHDMIYMGPNFSNCSFEGMKHYDIYSIDWLMSELHKMSNPDKHQNVLIIFDDVVSDVSKDSNNPDLQKLLYNRRWIIPNITISLIFTTQKYSLFPAKFRGVLSWIISFQIPSEDFKKLMKEHIYESKNSLNHQLTSHFQRNPHNFVFIKLDKFGVFLNFSKIC